MVDYVSTAIAGASLVVSGVTLWWTTWHPGTLRMTQPTMIYFGPDGKRGLPKLTLRPMLYSTSQRGHVVESIYAKLYRGDSWQMFNIWVHGDDALVRGGGMKVGPDGVVCYHHFLLPRDESTYEFRPGAYRLEVFASFVGATRPIKLIESTLNLTIEHAAEMKEEARGVYFDWDPDSRSYYASVDVRDRSENPLLEILASMPEGRPKAKAAQS